MLEGAKLAVLGMSTVFLFLVLLIYCMKLTAKLLHGRFDLRSGAKTGAPSFSKKLAAVTAAIAEYEKN